MTKTDPNSLIGKKFGRMAVLKIAARADGNGSTMAECLCDCGTRRVTRVSRLLSNTCKSCGCLQYEYMHSKFNLKHGHAVGKSSREYKAWAQMLHRCRNKNNMSYARYGGRGITVCERWLIFENFIADMGACPGGMLNPSLERLDNNGNYCSENCVWLPLSEQAHNRSTNRHITYGGETHTISQWAKRLPGKTERSFLFNRLNWLRWSEEDSLRIKPMTKAHRAAFRDGKITMAWLRENHVWTDQELQVN